MHIKYEAQLEGWFRLTTRKAATGEVSQDTGWFKNLITNRGMDKIASSTVIVGAAVGRGTTPENVNDTLMQTFVAKSQTLQGGSPDPQIGSSTSPFYAKIYRVYRFAMGSVTGNISEVGSLTDYGFASNGSDAYLFSRTLIKDSGGNPVTITVLADEVLDVSYECRVYPQESPTIGSATLMGVGHTFNVVPLEINTAKAGNLLRGAMNFSGGVSEYYPSGSLSASPYSVTGTRGGFGSSPSEDSAYVPGSFKKFIKSVFSPGVGTGPIGAVRTTSASSSASSIDFGIEFIPPFNKASTVEFKVVYEISWSRRSS